MSIEKARCPWKEKRASFFLIYLTKTAKVHRLLRLEN
jgi:hypothetical protein